MTHRSLTTIDTIGRLSQLASLLWIDYARVSRIPHTSERQGLILSALLESGETPLNHLQLVHLTGIDRSTMSEVVRRMEKRKLLKRTRNKADQRAILVSLTATGKAEAETVRKVAAAVSRDLDRRVKGLAGVSIVDQDQAKAA